MTVLFKVAKHYMASHASFDETARYWAEIYAGAPRKTAKPSGTSAAGDSSGKPSAPKRDEIAMAGLERAHVEQFCDLGFPQAKVVCRSFCLRWSWCAANTPSSHHHSDRCFATAQLSGCKCCKHRGRQDCRRIAEIDDRQSSLFGLFRARILVAVTRLLVYLVQRQMAWNMSQFLTCDCCSIAP